MELSHDLIPKVENVTVLVDTWEPGGVENLLVKGVTIVHSNLKLLRLVETKAHLS